MVSKGDQRIRMYEHKTNKRYFRDKMIKNNLIILQSKLKLVLGLKSLPGILYIRAMLMKIELSKQIFVLEIQDGLEVFICKDLSQQDMPLSFRFYDPIIHIILEKMTNESSDYFKLKNTLKKEIYTLVDRKL